MSEYQYIAFRALDRPLTDKEMKFARTQSSRAEITRWAFTNEYHFGDFHGDPEKLLLHGYDIQLHYSSFGIHTLRFRLPVGLPFPRPVWEPYVDGQRVSWSKFKTKGRGGVLTVEPGLEAVDYIGDPDGYLDLAVQVREDLVRGDLRALYVLWLCGACDAYEGDWETVEPPIPAGLGQVSKACSELLGFFDLDPLTVAAAAEQSAPSPKVASEEEIVAQWVQSQGEEDCRELARRLLLDKNHEVRAEVMAKIASAKPTSQWPTTPGTRTFQQLWEQAGQLREEENAKARVRKEKAAQREAQRQEKARQERIAKMAQNPRVWLEEADRLAALRGRANFNAAADMLAELQEAVGGEKGAHLARTQAASLLARFPTQTYLKGALRKRGLVS